MLLTMEAIRLNVEGDRHCYHFIDRDGLELFEKEFVLNFMEFI